MTLPVLTAVSFGLMVACLLGLAVLRRQARRQAHERLLRRATWRDPNRKDAA